MLWKYVVWMGGRWKRLRTTSNSLLLISSTETTSSALSQSVYWFSRNLMTITDSLYKYNSVIFDRLRKPIGYYLMQVLWEILVGFRSSLRRVWRCLLGCCTLISCLLPPSSGSWFCKKKSQRYLDSTYHFTDTRIMFRKIQTKCLCDNLLDLMNHSRDILCSRIVPTVYRLTVFL